MVPKEGKGKYNVTLPAPYEFLQKEKTKTIREHKLEQMLADKEQDELQYVGYVFRANDIPRSTKMPLYQQLMHSNESRRQEVRRVSMALTKQNEKPFSFYERDKQRLHSGG